MLKWIKPNQGKVKLNTDGSISNNGARIGGIIRNEYGHVIMDFVAKVDCHNINKEEAQAAKYGIQWCAQNELTNCLIELDSMIIVDMIKNIGTNNLKLKTIIEDIVEIINTMNCSTEYCLREINQVADGQIWCQAWGKSYLSTLAEDPQQFQRSL